MKEFLEKFNKVYDQTFPWIRVNIPQHLIEKFNHEFNESLVSMAVNVAKGVEVTDELLWNFMIDRPKGVPFSFNDGSWINNPPHTGRKKVKLNDI